MNHVVKKTWRSVRSPAGHANRKLERLKITGWLASFENQFQGIEVVRINRKRSVVKQKK